MATNHGVGMKLDIPQDRFEELEKEILNGLNDIAPALAIWLFNHPKAENYLKVHFTGSSEDQQDGDFVVIIQKPSLKQASCPFCRGTEVNPKQENEKIHIDVSDRKSRVAKCHAITRRI
jgi:hypothetical protein